MRNNMWQYVCHASYHWKQYPKEMLTQPILWVCRPFLDRCQGMGWHSLKFFVRNFLLTLKHASDKLWKLLFLYIYKSYLRPTCVNALSGSCIDTGETLARQLVYKPWFVYNDSSHWERTAVLGDKRTPFGTTTKKEENSHPTETVSFVKLQGRKARLSDWALRKMSMTFERLSASTSKCLLWDSKRVSLFVCFFIANTKTQPAGVLLFFFSFAGVPGGLIRVSSFRKGLVRSWKKAGFTIDRAALLLLGSTPHFSETEEGVPKKWERQRYTFKAEVSGQSVLVDLAATFWFTVWTAAQTLHASQVLEWGF